MDLELQHVKVKMLDTTSSNGLLISFNDSNDMITFFLRKLAFVDLLCVSYTCKELFERCRPCKLAYISYLRERLGDYLLKAGFYQSIDTCGITGSFLLYYLTLNKEWHLKGGDGDSVDEGLLPQDIDVMHVGDLPFDHMDVTKEDGIIMVPDSLQEMFSTEEEILFRQNFYFGFKQSATYEHRWCKEHVRAVSYLTLADTSEVYSFQEEKRVKILPSYDNKLLDVNFIRLRYRKLISAREVIRRHIKCSFDLKFLMNSLVIETDTRSGSTKATLKIEYLKSLLRKESEYYIHSNLSMDEKRVSERIKKYTQRGFTIDEYFERNEEYVNRDQQYEEYLRRNRHGDPNSKH